MIRELVGIAVWFVVLLLAVPFVFVGLFFLSIYVKRKEARACERDSSEHSSLPW